MNGADALAAIQAIEPKAATLQHYWLEWVGAGADECVLHCLALVRVEPGKFEEVAFDAWHHDGAEPVAERVAPVFDPALVRIERKRFSTTQGEVLVEYAGQRIEQYGDAIALRDGEWRGYSDEFLMNVARREAIERGLAS
jgi:hypothetical protein